jgi:hypothetical protein
MNEKKRNVCFLWYVFYKITKGKVVCTSVEYNALEIAICRNPPIYSLVRDRKNWRDP